MDAIKRMALLDQRVERLDARIKESPGQIGLDLTAKAEKPAGGKAGKPCGGGHISAEKTCHKGSGYRPTPQVKQGVQIKPMSLNAGGDSTYDPAAEKKMAAGGVKAFRNTMGGNPKQNFYFRDRQAAEHWYADDNAKSDADLEFGSANRKGKEWQAEYRAAYVGTRNLLRDASDRELLETIQAYAAAGRATSRGTATDVRIAGNPHSRPIREGTFTAKAAAGQEPQQAKPSMSSQDVVTSKQQAAFARQQQQAAKQAGDQRGANAWRQEERTVEKARVQAAISQQGQSQTSLFGVTEYDETMPLFRQRRDAADGVAQLLGQILGESLPGAHVLDWSRQPRGITAGRVAAEGLVYRFRCDSEAVVYSPAWDGITEEQWELRSEGFLQARDPNTRLDFKRGVKFEQQRSKRKCSKGYACGSSCIAMSKECRVNPSSALSKARLRQLQALAKEGDTAAATKAQELQMERDMKAQKLQQGRQVGRLQKMLEDPRVAEMVRTGKVPDATQAAAKPGDVRNVKPDEIEVDPERFQYKMGASASGEVGSLSGVQKWDPNLAGVVSVWQDPADGKTYVVNGHNRLGLARRLGAEEITVRYLKAKDAREARAIGAKQNIAEGAGKETDAAKFFRDTGIKSMEQVQAQGLPLNSGKAEKGLALANLPEEMFQDVIQGKLRMRQAAVIGASGLDEGKQREVYKVLKERPRMTDETLQEYVEQLSISQRQKQTELTLFGEEEQDVDTGLARAELTNGLKKALGREARLLGSVSKDRKAVEVLQEKGGNVINVEQSQQQAQEANTVLRVFNELKNVSGPVKTALDLAAGRITGGENKSQVQRELREAVIEAMEQELRSLGLKKDTPTNEAPTMSMFDSADPLDRAIDRLDALLQRMDHDTDTIGRIGVELLNLRYGTRSDVAEGGDFQEAAAAAGKALAQAIANGGGDAPQGDAAPQGAGSIGARMADVFFQITDPDGGEITIGGGGDRIDSAIGRYERLVMRLDAARKCLKGYACGNSCIAKNRTCKVKGGAAAAKLQQAVKGGGATAPAAPAKGKGKAAASAQAPAKPASKAAAKTAKAAPLAPAEAPPKPGLGAKAKAIAGKVASKLQPKGQPKPEQAEAIAQKAAAPAATAKAPVKKGSILDQMDCIDCPMNEKEHQEVFARDKALNERMKAVKLSRGMKKALDIYTADAEDTDFDVTFRDINNDLRGQSKTPGVSSVVKQLDAALEALPKNDDGGVFYRAMDASEPPASELLQTLKTAKPGTAITDPGYSSYSMSRNVAREFMGFYDSIVFVTRSPELRSLGNNSITARESHNEYEALLPRGHQLKLVQTRAENNGRLLIVEVE